MTFCDQSVSKFALQQWDPHWYTIEKRTRFRQKIFKSCQWYNAGILAPPLENGELIALGTPRLSEWHYVTDLGYLKNELILNSLRQRKTLPKRQIEFVHIQCPPGGRHRLEHATLTFEVGHRDYGMGFTRSPKHCLDPFWAVALETRFEKSNTHYFVWYKATMPSRIGDSFFTEMEGFLLLCVQCLHITARSRKMN